MRFVFALAVLAGCGRIGYDPVPGPEVPIDAVDAPDLTWVDVPCGMPVRLHDFGASLMPAPPSPYLIDVAATTAGFVAIWAAGHGTEITAVAADDNGRLALVEPYREGLASNPTAISVAAIGNEVLLGVDDGAAIQLAPLDHNGASRGPIQTIAGHRGHGHGFIGLKPGDQGFVVVGDTATDTNVFTRDRAAEPIGGPARAFKRTSSGSGVAALDAGYMLLSTQPASPQNCDTIPVDESIVPTAASHEIAMTCLNASIVRARATGQVVAAFNCTNDAVWVVAGTPGQPLSSPRAVYQGDTAASASDPRVAPQAVHLWYTYRVAGTHLGRALIGDNGAEVRAPMEVYQSPTVVAHDLVTRGDVGYMVWLEAGVRDELWTMRLCP